MTFTGIFVPGLNTCTYLANPECRVETFFLTPELKAAGSAVKFIPLCYADILARLQIRSDRRGALHDDHARRRRAFAASVRWWIFWPSFGR